MGAGWELGRGVLTPGLERLDPEAPHRGLPGNRAWPKGQEGKGLAGDVGYLILLQGELLLTVVFQKRTILKMHIEI